MTRAAKLAVPFLASAMAVAGTVSVAAEPAHYPDITGTWSASYPVAFAKGNPVASDQAAISHAEINIYRHEDNLFWYEYHWNSAAYEGVRTDYGVGSFDARTPTVVHMTQISAGLDGAQNTTGFVGEVDGDQLYLNFIGAGRGATFSAVFDRTDSAPTKS